MKSCLRCKREYHEEHWMEYEDVLCAYCYIVYMGEINDAMEDELELNPSSNINDSEDEE